MKKKRKTLLDLDRVPTLNELREFFRENDLSAAAYMDMDYDKCRLYNGARGKGSWTMQSSCGGIGH